MRLINTRTLKLESFDDDKIPVYAILSSKWEDDEVIFQDMNKDGLTQKKDYRKISEACKQARKDKVGYIWIDTCCIDRTKSSELSQAINSMYQWYKESKKCYAYLFDVLHSKTNAVVGSSFEKSVWFTRGWTLQELLAPREVHFFDCQWNAIGTRTSLFLRIASITRIAKEALLGTPLDSFSVAQRMSWAAGRKTTCIEDVAYSLMGIFDVRMAMLYGEGSEAFTRLQKKIIKRSVDQSIFGWTRSTSQPQLLASSPNDFRDCTDIVQHLPLTSPSPYSMTNVGLKIKLPLIAWSLYVYLAILYCGPSSDKYTAIFLYKVQTGFYATTTVNQIPFTDISQGQLRILLGGRTYSGDTATKVLVRKNGEPEISRLYGFHLQAVGEWKKAFHCRRMRVYARGWNKRDEVLEIPIGESGTAGVIAFWKRSRSNFTCYVLKLGFDWAFNPVCMLARYCSPKPNRKFYLPRTSKEIENHVLDSSWISRMQEADALKDAAIDWISRYGRLYDNKCWHFKKLSLDSGQPFEVDGIDLQLEFKYEWNVKEYQRAWTIRLGCREKDRYSRL
ncbi:uncharacterized protein Z519_12606 [Cladophialophora bantiana CBS 173.52]|uniref:Heterokaryon incompatibility domain-containing protein n=1 Tax=Cladophialophora bantiana (strain ATCC 10958 / CBS 173.52 / CDC B-1940 / NIH 8579) TaxID=1442370 RepID=A0A0D2H7H3_CLAB1|nr:uncharacterized protein Z519_12606 [Cladophialophora bantiana CBS 173.52]KIW86820.1 hypothetical protein Z519_12606 [Cladophialophora bantiana CBS 173.52]